MLALPLSAEDLPIIVAESGSEEVDALVAQLVSRRPHPFPPSGEIRDEHTVPGIGNYITKEVGEAITKLEQLGPGASPFLLVHLDDGRYSYSRSLPSTVGNSYSGWIMVTVGDVARDVITGGFESGWLYKWRDGPDGAGFSPPQFSDFLKTQGGLMRWVAKNSKKTKPEVFNEFIDWCIATERDRGFQTEEAEKKLTGRYEARKQKVEQGAGGKRD